MSLELHDTHEFAWLTAPIRYTAAQGLTSSLEKAVRYSSLSSPEGPHPPGMVMVWTPPPPSGPVVRVDWCECWLMESESLQVVLICMVFARNLTKCGNKRQIWKASSLAKPDGGTLCRGPGSRGRGGEVNTEHESICIYIYMSVWEVQAPS